MLSRIILRKRWISFFLKPSAERVFVERETLLAPTHLSTIVWGAEKRYVVNSIHVYATLNNSQLAQ